MQLARFEQYDHERLRIASDNSNINDSEEEGEIVSSLYMDRKWEVITKPDATSYGQQIFQECGFIASQEKTSVNSKINSTYIDIDDKSNLLQKETPESPIVWYPFKSQRATLFTAFIKWRGVVLKIYKDCFLCRLVDQDGNSPDEEAEILLSEISYEDLQLIDIGAVFYWSIGYQTNPSGSRIRSSIIRFRRLPVWRFGELSEAQKKAEKTLIALGIT
ncbi:hypothetical protein BuS5_00342 [Desulfosarcina sp. BuS5]|uniref:hypothetical protein n=1 Tax=Desulfosarcina sp. BuS5 TaxID=933262 RepID=UPI0004892F5E|nr:hypothetical protein [Desulfosarcina sp. BuS5]WDN87374.1 hypothetical protein BuS5_00342 [Desulfosarcina sp. BuS5]